MLNVLVDADDEIVPMQFCTAKERQSLPVVNHYLIVFNACTVFLDWKNGAEYLKELKVVLHS